MCALVTSEFTATTTANAHVTVFIGVKLLWLTLVTGMQPQWQQSMSGSAARHACSHACV